MNPVNINDYEIIAKGKLTQMAYDYYSSGACDEITLKQNCEAYAGIKLKYRVLKDVSSRDLSVTILGQKISFPVMIAPTAFQGMAHPDGELATVRAAGKGGTIMVLSTLSNTAVEDVVAESKTPVWFQLYVYKDRNATKELVRRVESAGCKVIVVTVDAPYLGIRERDVRNQFNLPDGLTVKCMDAVGLGGVDEVEGGSGLAGYFASKLDPSLSWKDIEWLRSITKLPIILKGIACAEDAKLAVKHGVDGIIVSNHGGRQLDTCRATIEVLPEVTDAVRGKTEILIDGGIRRGTDILKAIALGAKAVLIGRPVLWGLAAEGEQGVTNVLEIFRKEFDLAMALSGCTSVNEISIDLIAA
jgi:4-hydroxymandelate oxidase